MHSEYVCEWVNASVKSTIERFQENSTRRTQIETLARSLARTSNEKVGYEDGGHKKQVMDIIAL